LWAIEVKRALDHGLDATLRELQAHRREIEALPDTGVPGELRRDLVETLGVLAERLNQEDFYRHTADLNSLLTNLRGRVRAAVDTMADQLRQRLRDGTEELQQLGGWQELTQEERGHAVNQLEELAMDAPRDLAGLKKLLARDYDIHRILAEMKRRIQREGEDRRRKRLVPKPPDTGTPDPARLTRTVAVPATITRAADITTVIQELEDIRSLAGDYAEIEVSFSVQPGGEQ
jgi:hypothetical protein